MDEIDKIYAFVYRGILTDAILDANGRQKNATLNATELQELRRSLNFDLLDLNILSNAQRMALVYIALHTLENMIRNYVSKTLSNEYGEDWWEKIPDKIRTRVIGRMDEDEKLRWHSSRGKSQIMYSDFGDLQSMIYAHWHLFEDDLISQDWMKQILTTLEKSRNVIMHGGVLERIDIERIGINIRDWLTQAE